MLGFCITKCCYCNIAAATDVVIIVVATSTVVSYSTMRISYCTHMPAFKHYRGTWYKFHIYGLNNDGC